MVRNAFLFEDYALLRLVKWHGDQIRDLADLHCAPSELSKHVNTARGAAMPGEAATARPLRKGRPPGGEPTGVSVGATHILGGEEGSLVGHDGASSCEAGRPNRLGRTDGGDAVGRWIADGPCVPRSPDVSVVGGSLSAGLRNRTVENMARTVGSGAGPDGLQFCRSGDHRGLGKASG